MEQAVAYVSVTQRAWNRSPVGTRFLGEVFSGFFPRLLDKCRGALGPQGPRISFDRDNNPFITALLE